MIRIYHAKGKKRKNHDLLGISMSTDAHECGIETPGRQLQHKYKEISQFNNCVGKFVKESKSANFEGEGDDEDDGKDTVEDVPALPTTNRPTSGGTRELDIVKGISWLYPRPSGSQEIFEWLWGANHRHVAPKPHNWSC